MTQPWEGLHCKSVGNHNTKVLWAQQRKVSWHGWASQVSHCLQSFYCLRALSGSIASLLKTPVWSQKKVTMTYSTHFLIPHCSWDPCSVWAHIRLAKTVQMEFFLWPPYKWKNEDTLRQVPGSLTLLCMNRGCLELLSSHGRSIHTTLHCGGLKAITRVGNTSVAQERDTEGDLRCHQGRIITQVWSVLSLQARQLEAEDRQGEGSSSCRGSFHKEHIENTQSSYLVDTVFFEHNLQKSHQITHQQGIQGILLCARHLLVLWDP